CVLLDRTGFAKVRELGPFIFALLDGTAQLREREDRDMELLCELLQASADLRDFLNAIFSRAPSSGSLQQLEIIDDHHADTLLALETPGTCTKRGNREGWRIVDIERQTGQFGGGASELLELLRLDLAGPDLFAGHL